MRPDDEVVDRVLSVVELIPEGQVVSYGDIAELTGCGPRQVGRILAVYGSAVCWWRVTNSRGDFPAIMRESVRPHWEREGIAWKTNGRGCRVAHYRADLTQLADVVEETVCFEAVHRT